MKKLIYIILLTTFCCCGYKLNAQNNKADTSNIEFMPYYIQDGDTIYHLDIAELVVVNAPNFKNKREWRKYYRMVFDLPRAYPFSKIIKSELDIMENHFGSLKTKKEKKKYIKTVEQELSKLYKEPLKKLSKSQGKMLVKLVNRETGNTAYKIVKEIKGGGTAFFWQCIATVCGINLNAHYKQDSKDSTLHNLIQIYENGDYNALYYKIFGMDIEEHTRYLENKRNSKKKKKK